MSKNGDDDVAELRRRLDMAEDELTFLKAVFEEYKDSSGELEAELDAQLKDLERSNLALKRENEQIRAQLQSTVARSRKSAEEASNLTTALEAHLEELTKREKKAQSRIQILEKEIETLRSAQAAAESAPPPAPAPAPTPAPPPAAPAATGGKVSSAELDAAKAEVDRFRSESDKLRAELEKVRTDLSKFQREQASQQSAIASVKSIVYDARVVATKLANMSESRFTAEPSPIKMPNLPPEDADDVESIRDDITAISDHLARTLQLIAQSTLARTLVVDMCHMLADHNKANQSRLNGESEQAINKSSLLILGKILVLGSSLPQFKLVVNKLQSNLQKEYDAGLKDEKLNSRLAHEVLEVCQDIMVTVFQPMGSQATEKEKEELMATMKADALSKIEEVRRQERANAEAATNARLQEAETKARKAIEQLRVEQQDQLKKELQSARTEAKQLIEQARREALEEASVTRKELEEEIYQSVAAEMDSLREALEKSEAQYTQAALKQKMYQDSMKNAIIGQSRGMLDAMRKARDEIETLKRISQSELANTQKVVNENLNLVRKVTRTIAKSDVAQLSMMYERELDLRVALQDQLQSLKGNIRVFCRIRPLLGREIEDGEIEAVTKTDEMTVTGMDENGKSTSFMFDRVFGPGDDQQTVFDEMRQLCLSAMDGYNVCLFAYGITGSGKTFTVEGGEAGRNDEKMQGLVFRTIRELYRIAYGERSGAYETQIKVQLLELYNEEFRDLLVPAKDRVDKVEVRLIPDVGVQVEGCVITPCRTAGDAMNCVATGYTNRTVKSTNSNAVSSRSHSILTLHLSGRNIKTNKVYEGKLHFVDLAGSERVGKSGVQGDALKEAQAINKSLSALGDVIQALSKKEKFVPFRNSQLTQLLKESLGGNSKTVMICNIAPCAHSMSETLNSLRFATRAHSVEMGKATKNEADSEPAKIKNIKGNLAELESKFKSGGKGAPAAKDAAAVGKDGKMMPPTSARGKSKEKSPRATSGTKK